MKTKFRKYQFGDKANNEKFDEFVSALGESIGDM